MAAHASMHVGNDHAWLSHSLVGSERRLIAAWGVHARPDVSSVAANW